MSDCFDYRPWTVDCVTTGKNIRVVALEGQGIHLHGVPVTQGADTLLSKAGPVRLLSDGWNHRVYLDGKFRAGNRFRPATAALIRLA